MKGALKLAVVVVAVLAAIIGYWQKNKAPAGNNTSEVIKLSSPGRPVQHSMPDGLIGEKILQKYATAETTLKEDMEMLRRLNISLVTLVKTHDQMAIGCNADLADALRGENPYKQRFLPDGHPAFNEEGQIIDRYDTPVYIHVESAGYYTVRSAGADQKLWTKDDVNLLPSGEFAE